MASRKAKVLSLSIAQSMLVVVGVISGMVLSRVLSITDYGTYLQTFLAYDTAVPLLTLGLPSALYYFLPGAKNRSKLIILENLFLLFIVGSFFSLFLAFGGTEFLARRFRNPDLEKTLEWMIYYPLYTFPILASAAIWVTREKVKLNAIHNVAKGFLLTFAIIVSAVVTRNFEAPTFIRIFLPLIFFPFTLYLIFKGVPGNWEYPNLNSMWTMLKFSVPLGLASVFGTLARQLANLIVSFMTTPREFAIYSNGAREVPLIGIITGSIAVVIMADMAKYIKEENYPIALELFRKAAAISSSLLFPIMVFLMLFAEDFIQILYSDKYAESVVPFRYYLFIIPIRIAYYGSAFVALGKTKIVFIRSIFDLLLTGAFCYLFILWLGPAGAALGLIVTLFVWSLPFNLYSLSKNFKCSMMDILPLRTIGLTFFISLISSVLPSLLLFTEMQPLLRFTFAAFLFIVTYLATASRYLPMFQETITHYKNRFTKL